MLKRVILAIILVFLISGVGFAFQNEPEGFRNLKWGDPPTEDMVYIYSLPEYFSKMYRRNEDKLQIGDAKLTELIYSFYSFDESEKFESIKMRYKGITNYNFLKLICTERFGKETKTRFYEHWWSGQMSWVYLEYDLINEEGYLEISSCAIWDEILDKRKQKAAEAGEDF